MTDRERYINARKEARRYKRKYLALKQAIENVKNDVGVYELDCDFAGGTEECRKCCDNIFGSFYRIMEKHLGEKEDAERRTDNSEGNA